MNYTEKMIEAIDGSCGVEVDENKTIAIVWYGGETFHMYSLFTWQELTCVRRVKNGKILSPQNARIFMRSWLKECSE